MSFSTRSGVCGTSVLRWVLLLITAQWFMFTEAKLPVCSKSREGNSTLYRKVSGDDGVLFCIRKSGKYVWKFLDGSSTFGENFDPAKDCSDIVDNVPEAKDGFYWLKDDKKRLSKVWCDVHTDGGGFMLIGMKDSPKTWNVPSNDIPVDPMGPPHWSSQFGGVIVQDFAIQISTTKNFKDTKAHWSYRLKPNRALGNLFGVGSGGCTDVDSGIGNVSYVKDILTETVVNKKFNCSKFGPHVSASLGWGRMNYCLGNKCSAGYAYLPGTPAKLDMYGSFSFSVSSELSGITDDATAFLGCDNGECCACYGPKGGSDHYCSKKCTAINGGTVLKSQVYAWFWIRTRMPKRVWKRCMEFKMKTKAGKIETYFIDRETGTPRKGSCSKQFKTFLNEGTLLVENKESLDNFPPVPGIFSYRKDNKKVYVSKGDTWEAIGSEKEIENLTAQVKHLQEKLENKNSEQDETVQNLATNVNGKFQSLEDQSKLELKKMRLINENLKAHVKHLQEKLENKNSQQDAKFQNLATNVNRKLQTLQDKLKDNRFKNENLTVQVKHLEQNSEKQEAMIQNLATYINGTLQSLEDKSKSESEQMRLRRMDLTAQVKHLTKNINARVHKIDVDGSKINPRKSCKNILAANKFAESGSYWIQLDQRVSNELFHIYCDMETDGGGWTLVYSYTFTNYSSFYSGSNAVTPRPNWPAWGTNVPISTTPPLNEASLGAVDYSLWKEIGKEFMIKSNINDWLVCKPIRGSLVTRTGGSIRCQNIKDVGTACHGVAPHTVAWWDRGPSLDASWPMYIFEGDTRFKSPIEHRSWPVHDPCGKWQPNQKKGVSNPGGQIYLR